MHRQKAIGHHSCLDQMLASARSSESFKNSFGPLLVIYITHLRHVAKEPDHAWEQREDFEQWTGQAIEPLAGEGEVANSFPKAQIVLFHLRILEQAAVLAGVPEQVIFQTLF